MFLLKKLGLKSKTRSPRSPKKEKKPPPPPPPICPWSARRLNLLPNASPSRFPGSGHALTATATAAGELFFFGGLGGLVPDSRDSAYNDLYVFSTRDLTVTLFQTSGDAPSPRFGHASALVGDDLLIWGGATNSGDQGKLRRKGPHDDSLYLLNLESRKWTRVVVNGPGPEGRYYHAMTIVGSKLFVFGGEIDGKFLNDMWAIDLSSLKSNPLWDSYESTPGAEKPPPTASHVLVTISNSILLFGGADSRTVHHRTWLFDVSTRKWTRLQCTGDIPSPREGHAAAIVGDIMYVFGGRGAKDAHLGDLIAFRLSTREWFQFQNTGPSPSGRWRHSMASDGTWVFVLGGEPSTTARGDETALIYVFDAKHINYPIINPHAIEPSVETTQFERNLPPTQEQPQHSTSSSSGAYVAHGTSPFQGATPEDLDHVTSPQITRERNPVPNGLPSQPMGVNGKPGRVPEEDDGGEASERHRVKFAPPDASSEGEVAELERQLSEALVGQTYRDRRLAQLTDELALKSALLEQAEATVEATKRAGMEHADRLLAQVEQKDVELVDMQAKIDQLLLSRNQLARAFEQAQNAPQKATPRAADADADEQTQRAAGQPGQYEAELAEVRAKLEARESELEAVRLQLADAENGWAKSNTEAGLVGTNEAQITHGLMGRLRAMEAEMASLRLSEKSSEAMQSRNEG